MGHAAQTPTFSAADYLIWEAAQAERHEYNDGEVFAMAGAEDRHVTVTMNLAFALRQHLGGTPCRTYMSDMRLHVAAANSYFYPDVLVTCCALDQANAMVKSEPRLIVEVLSPTTAAYDRRLKFGHYRTLAPHQRPTQGSTDCPFCVARSASHAAKGSAPDGIPGFSLNISRR